MNKYNVLDELDAFMITHKEIQQYANDLKKTHKLELELKDIKIAELEKALELACERVKYFEEMQDKEMGFSDFFGYDSDYDLQAIVEQYKEQAKEMMKSE